MIHNAASEKYFIFLIACMEARSQQSIAISNLELPLFLFTQSRSYLKKVDQGSGQGAGRLKSAAYTVVCEHFEPTRNAAMGPQTHF
jgi:hypothetical protein